MLRKFLYDYGIIACEKSDEEQEIQGLQEHLREVVNVGRRITVSEVVKHRIGVSQSRASHFRH